MRIRGKLAGNIRTTTGDSLLDFTNTAPWRFIGEDPNRAAPVFAFATGRRIVAGAKQISRVQSTP